MAKKLIEFIPQDPVNLSLKGKLLSVFSCFSVILMAALVCRLLDMGPGYPLVVASMGASSVIVFIIPHSPLAQPWPLVGGQIVSAIVGVASTQVDVPIVLAAACAVGGSVFSMLLLRCLHPPGAATALAPLMSGDALVSLGYDFVLVPVGVNVITMLAVALVVNRWMLGHHYPVPIQRAVSKEHTKEVSNTSSISDQDLEDALNNLDMFVDITRQDLGRLVKDVQTQAFKRIGSDWRCRDIMVTDVVTVEYGTEVEDAWLVMHQQQLKAIPVVDRANRVIGIITRHDFFKFVNLSPYESVQDKFRSFIRRTRDVTTDKPESVGHIMTAQVMVMPESAHIVELVHLMSSQGYRQIPIINEQRRLTGMVYQADLISAIFQYKGVYG